MIRFPIDMYGLIHPTRNADAKDGSTKNHRAHTHKKKNIIIIIERMRGFRFFSYLNAYTDRQTFETLPLLDCCFENEVEKSPCVRVKEPHSLSLHPHSIQILVH